MLFDQSVVDRFWRNVTKGDPDSCWEWSGSFSPNGYGVLKVGGRAGRNHGAHRVSWQIANGRAIPEGMFICHHCDNKQCVNPAHLFIGTAADNTHDMMRKGRQHRGPHADNSNRKRGDEHHFRTKPELICRGEKNGQAKLTEAQVVAIRAAYATGSRSQQSIADEHGVSQRTISLVVRHEYWKQVA